MWASGLWRATGSSLSGRSPGEGGKGALHAAEAHVHVEDAKAVEVADDVVVRFEGGVLRQAARYVLVHAKLGFRRREKGGREPEGPVLCQSPILIEEKELAVYGSSGEGSFQRSLIFGGSGL